MVPWPRNQPWRILLRDLIYKQPLSYYRFQTSKTLPLEGSGILREGFFFFVEVKSGKRCENKQHRMIHFVGWLLGWLVVFVVLVQALVFYIDFYRLLAWWFLFFWGWELIFLSTTKWDAGELIWFFGEMRLFLEDHDNRIDDHGGSPTKNQEFRCTSFSCFGV